MQILLELDGPVPVVKLRGRLDGQGAAEFNEAWSRLPAHTAHVVIDLSGVDYMSSIGVRSLITVEKQLKERHGRTTLAALSPCVTTVLRTTGLLNEFQHTAAFDEALQLAAA